MKPIPTAKKRPSMAKTAKRVVAAAKASAPTAKPAAPRIKKPEKRLFALRYISGNGLVRDENGEVQYFGSRAEARVVRDITNTRDAVITRGPDHRLGLVVL